MNKHPSRLREACALAGLASVASLPAGIAQAGGFALIEHGASGMGVAYAGAAAVADDASTAWFNPAGLSELDGRTIALAGHVLAAQTDFSNRGTTQPTVLGGGEISGPDSASPGTTAYLPNFYYAAPINERWNYGLSIGVPFGSSTEYDDEWVGRYTTVKSGINVIDINPSFSYRYSDAVRLGAGISVQRLSAELGSAVDSGAVCGAVYGPDGANSPQTCFERGLFPGEQSRDGYGEVTGDSTGIGFNIGALFLPSEATRIGVTFRSGVDHELEGEGEFDTDAQLRELLDAVGRTELLASADASAEVSLPPSFTLSAAHTFDPRVQVLAELIWTGWSSFDELRIVYDSEQPDTRSVQDWNDALRASIGVNFDYSAKLRLRAGLAYDEEPIPGPEKRTARIPGNDRTWLAFGLGYAVNEKLSFDLGYTHIFIDDAAIDNPNREGNSGRGGPIVRGLYEGSADIFSAQISWQFD